VAEKEKNEKKMFLVFSHRLTPEQETEARTVWKVTSFLPLPEQLQQIWSQIPADKKKISDVLCPIRQWLKNESVRHDLALIQGDFGATWLMVDFALKADLVPVYSVTQRLATEERQPDGSIKNIHIFNHKMFRPYNE